MLGSFWVFVELVSSFGGLKAIFAGWKLVFLWLEFLRKNDILRCWRIRVVGFVEIEIGGGGRAKSEMMVVLFMCKNGGREFILEEANINR